jgi:hypothetical protein
LIAQNVETFESCSGGEGHAFPEPTVRFEGNASEGLRAVSAAIAFGLPVATLRRTWAVRGGMLHGPWWEMTFDPPRPAEINDPLCSGDCSLRTADNRQSLSGVHAAECRGLEGTHCCHDGPD